MSDSRRVKAKRAARMKDRAKCCETCGRRFATRPGLTRHLAAHALGERSGLAVEAGERALRYLEDERVIEVDGRRGLRLTPEYADWRSRKSWEAREREGGG